MEDVQNNTTTNQPTANEQVTQSVNPATDVARTNQQPTAATAHVPGSNNKKKFLTVFFIIFLLITAVMIFIVMSGKKTAPIETPVTTIPSQAPSVVQSPSIPLEEEEVNNIDVEDTSPTEFPEIEKDIQNL